MTAETRTVLVTGATGNVGRPLVDSLLAGGHRVRALTRDPARAALPAGVDVIAGNLADTAGLARAFDGADAAHLITFGDDYAPLTNGAEIAALAIKSGLAKVSILKGDVTKSPLEAEIEASGLRWTGLGPVEFMSNTLDWAESVRTESVIRAGFPESRSAMIHDGDIAETAAVVLTTDGHDGREYWLTGPEVLTPPDQARIIGEVLGREIRFVALSRDEMIAEWRGQGFGDDDIEFFLAMRTDPPEAGYTVLPTVEQVTGRPARTYRTWVSENRAAFS
ncbi:NAD(P)H-binding protein [Actinoplanes sp. NBC_00393]|uniref:SDR family oxidoreductase n=1 Tax=Actinoplanes sp. NBC_00393 TaxID=2975953 RepID=UPI002E2301BE